MPNITLTIDPADLAPIYDPETGGYDPPADMQTLIIEAIARQVLAREKDLTREIRDTVTERIRAVVDERARVEVDAVFAGPIQRTTPWGEAKGEPTTVREIVREGVEKWINSPGRVDSLGSRDKNSLPAVINEVTRDVLTKDLAAACAEVRERVTAELRDKALQAAVAAITPRSR